jgi:hypothetical protein
MELTDETMKNLLKLTNIRKLERSIQKNFEGFGGDDRIKIQLYDWKTLPPNILKIMDEYVDKLEILENPKH